MVVTQATDHTNAWNPSSKQQLHSTASTHALLVGLTGGHLSHQSYTCAGPCSLRLQCCRQTSCNFPDTSVSEAMHHYQGCSKDLSYLKFAQPAPIRGYVAPAHAVLVHATSCNTAIYLSLDCCVLATHVARQGHQGSCCTGIHVPADRGHPSSCQRGCATMHVV